MSGSASPAPRVTHGVTLPGFVSRTGPLPPEPGCYVVLASGPSHARFHIGAGGRVVAEGRRMTSHGGARKQTVAAAAVFLYYLPRCLGGRRRLPMRHERYMTFVAKQKLRHGT